MLGVLGTLAARHAGAALNNALGHNHRMARLARDQQLNLLTATQIPAQVHPLCNHFKNFVLATCFQWTVHGMLGVHGTLAARRAGAALNNAQGHNHRMAWHARDHQVNLQTATQIPAQVNSSPHL